MAEHSDLGTGTRRALAIVTCMDARLDPLAYWDLEIGDAHVIRNAGGLVTDDVLRSLVLSHKLGTREVRLVAHTDCGVDKAPDAPPLEQRVRDGVRALREATTLPDDYAASGFVYDVATGELREITP